MKTGMTGLLVLVICSSLIGACNQSLSAEPPSSSKAVIAANPSSAATTKAEAKENDAGLLRPSFEGCVDRSEGATAAMQACMETEYRFHDDRMHAAYRALIASADATGGKLIELAQQDWLSSTERECAWDAQAEGQAQRLEAEYCNMRNTAKRANELEGRIGAVK